MLRKGIRDALRFPKGTYSTNIPFPTTPFLILVNCTFTITAPSFKCKFTFFPRKDLALFKPKFSIAFHHSTSFSAIDAQHCRQMGSLSPLKRIYSLMFSLLHLCFQGFLQRSKLQTSKTSSRRNVCQFLFLRPPQKITLSSVERCVKVNFIR